MTEEKDAHRTIVAFVKTKKNKIVVCAYVLQGICQRKRYCVFQNNGSSIISYHFISIFKIYL